MKMYDPKTCAPCGESAEGQTQSPVSLAIATLESTLDNLNGALENHAKRLAPVLSQEPTKEEDKAGPDAHATCDVGTKLNNLVTFAEKMRSLVVELDRRLEI